MITNKKYNVSLSVSQIRLLQSVLKQEIKDCVFEDTQKDLQEIYAETKWALMDRKESNTHMPSYELAINNVLNEVLCVH